MPTVRLGSSAVEQTAVYSARLMATLNVNRVNSGKPYQSGAIPSQLSMGLSIEKGVETSE